MKRFLTCATLVACILGGLRAAGQQPTFRGGSELVRVFVTVTDRDGRLVTALAQGDFEVRDENKVQPITQFVSGSMSGNLLLLRAAAGQLFPRLGDNDVARIGSFGHDVTISPEFTRDPAALTAALPQEIAPDAPTPMWRAIDQAMDTFTGSDDRRKVILVLSDGKDTGPMSFRQHPVSQGEVIDRARREDVMIYGVGMRSRNLRSQGIPPGGLQAALLADLPDPGLARVAEESGGGYIEIRGGQDLGAAFEQVADELHTQYLLAFAPPKRDGKVHDLSVKVIKGGMKPRARKSYVAPKD